MGCYMPPISSYSGNINPHNKLPDPIMPLQASTKKRPQKRRHILLTILLLTLSISNITAVKLGGKTVDDGQEVSTQTKKHSLIEKLLPITSTLFKRWIKCYVSTWKWISIFLWKIITFLRWLHNSTKTRRWTFIQTNHPNTRWRSRPKRTDHFHLNRLGSRSYHKVHLWIICQSYWEGPRNESRWYQKWCRSRWEEDSRGIW